jgi:membrane protein
MAESGRPNRWMRFVLQLADVAAVARARYGARPVREQERMPEKRRRTGGGRSEAGARVRTGAAPGGSASATGPTAHSAGRGGAPHAESRAKVGDPSAQPARAESSAIPEASRDNVVPHGAWPILKELFRRFGRDQCPAFAAALAFFSILSLVPIMLVALAALAFVYHNPHEAMTRLQSLLGNMLPGATAQGELRHLLVERANVEQSVTTLIQTRGIAGAVGLLSLLWASIQLFINAAPAMNAAYEVQETRGWIKLRLVALGLFVASGVLFLLSLLPSAAPTFIAGLHVSWLGTPGHVPWYINMGTWLVALAINITMFALIYKFLPNARTTWREAFVGGAITGVLWELAKRGFAYYLANFASYNKVYGALAGLMILILWIYYTAMILLLGAEAAALYQDVQQETARPERGAAPQPAAAATPRRRARA